MQETELHHKKLEKYYRIHSVFYDLTRWSFLFGRNEILNRIPDLPPNPRILEIGSGTGKNLLKLDYLFPDAQIIGVDLSTDMIEKAQNKIDDHQQIKLIRGTYGQDDLQLKSFNLILLSYSLTMFGSQKDNILQQVYTDLSNDGYVAVVDFFNTPFGWFKKWMKTNHVDVDGHLSSKLENFFLPFVQQKRKAFNGIWSYLMFIGRKRPPSQHKKTSKRSLKKV